MTETGLHFTRWETPQGVYVSALFGRQLGPGVYVLEFQNGEEYVGQAESLNRRIADHRRHHGDLIAVRTAPVPKTRLDAYERRLISARQNAGVNLRNLTLLSQPLGSSPLDLVVAPAVQKAWLTSSDDFDVEIDVDRVSEARRRQGDGVDDSFRRRTHKLLAHPQGHSVLELLALYMGNVIPQPHETETTGWVVTALPGTRPSSEFRRFSTLSIHIVEALYIGQRRDRGGRWSFHAVLNLASETEIPRRWAPHAFRSGYRTSGAVTAVEFFSVEELRRALMHPDVVHGARRFALGQLRKGTAMFSRHHNPALADAMFLRADELFG